MIENIPIIKSIIDLLVVIGKAFGKLFGRTPKSGVEAEIPKKTIIIPPNPNTHATWWHIDTSCLTYGGSFLRCWSNQTPSIDKISLPKVAAIDHDGSSKNALLIFGDALGCFISSKFMNYYGIACWEKASMPAGIRQVIYEGKKLESGALFAHKTSVIEAGVGNDKKPNAFGMISDNANDITLEEYPALGISCTAYDGSFLKCE